MRPSRTVLCISIRRSNGHRTAKQVKNTGQSTGICGHTGQTTPQSHMRLFTIGFDRVNDVADSRGGLCRQPSRVASFDKKVEYANLRRMPQSMSDTVAERAARGAASARRLPRPAPACSRFYSHCGLQRALSTPSPGGVFARKLHTCSRYNLQATNGSTLTRACTISFGHRTQTKLYATISRDVKLMKQIRA